MRSAERSSARTSRKIPFSALARPIGVRTASMTTAWRMVIPFGREVDRAESGPQLHSMPRGVGRDNVGKESRLSRSPRSAHSAYEAVGILTLDPIRRSACRDSETVSPATPSGFSNRPRARLSFGACGLLVGSPRPKRSAGAPLYKSQSGPTKPMVPPEPMAIGFLLKPVCIAERAASNAGPFGSVIHHFTGPPWDLTVTLRPTVDLC